MHHLVSLGRPVFAIGILALGVLCLVYADPPPGLIPLPAWLPAHQAWAWLFGLVLLAAGAGILLRRRARAAAIGLGLLSLLWLLALHLPLLATQPRGGHGWICLLEMLALCGACWVLAGTLSSDRPVRGPGERRLDQAARAGRYAFAAGLPVFGALHLIFAGGMAGTLPAWLPLPALWIYFTGLVQIAAGLAILAGVKARLAATLAGLLYGSWALVLHLSRVLAQPDIRSAWTGLSVAVALCGAAWLVADSLSDKNA